MAFKTAKQPAPIPPPDPADIANRRDSERRRRLGSGGRASTLITRMAETAMAAQQPRNTLTGLQG